MFHKILYTFLLIFPLLAQSQDAYLVNQNASKAALKQSFIDQFEIQNVGNMHLFTDNNPKNNDFFKGEEVAKEFKVFFPTHYWKFFRKKKYRPKAVYRIRGNGKEWYILRISDKKRKNTLRLFEFQGNQLTEKILLADLQCKWNKCEQIDAWIQDLDGDTVLDIIQKKQKRNRKGTVLEEVTKTYSLNTAGQFVEDNNLTFEKGDYQMQKLH